MGGEQENESLKCPVLKTGLNTITVLSILCASTEDEQSESTVSLDAMDCIMCLAYLAPNPYVRTLIPNVTMFKNKSFEEIKLSEM